MTSDDTASCNAARGGNGQADSTKLRTTRDAPLAGGAALLCAGPLDDNSRVGLMLLSQAFGYARDAQADPWDFALEVDALCATGLTISDLRWLVAKQFAEHGQETSVYGDAHRSFRRGDGFFFDHTTCVVLTPSGAAFVDNILRMPNQEPSASNVRWKPVWNQGRRELSFHGAVVKRYRVPARNQQVILDAFEEEGWPERIDDPLPVRRDVDPRTRLHDAINRLNRCQTNRLLRFRGNGAGTGISWERARAQFAGLARRIAASST
jgi:hypothetical protein